MGPVCLSVSPPPSGLGGNAVGGFGCWQCRPTRDGEVPSALAPTPIRRSLAPRHLQPSSRQVARDRARWLMQEGCVWPAGRIREWAVACDGAGTTLLGAVARA
ncbi:hypothetical protein VFPFJ_00680 [Purpureocillium lilacinum]|uniref:Uncharacterized protein n=1 Tax=Purpureocillium lilacinum TaxID=33203 RepID=A0A179HA94_PURLI|nr:hypothetical protein VFPFJ_00680 [Purpureocillium lilacinum]OAQ86608.1 hypothetical protein VFPBJ_00648 [Purpureocillium lilacinum]OAQ94571.1 hypothetical protein VFPFJ_00680 [Purpureocillium lilacinum]